MAGLEEARAGAGLAHERKADPLLARYRQVRAASESLAAPLSPEDMAAQSMPDASPAKWHLAHISWFFETFILGGQPGYTPYDGAFGYLFNSYYEALGARQPRPQRGLLTRPSAEEVFAYRRHVDEGMERLLRAGPSRRSLELILLGLAHEEQHQELLLTDILHLFAQSPLRPAYDPALAPAGPSADPGEMGFLEFDGGIVEIGFDGGAGESHPFAFDNETPRHQTLLRPYRLADRLVTNGEWMAFIEAGGYAKAELWLSDGWARAGEEGWEAPHYWERGDDGGWRVQTLAGLVPVDPHAPVVHVSYYEADAYARWRGLRLPTEAEWENAAGDPPRPAPPRLRPAAADPEEHGLRQLYGEAWQWTASPYSPYPGFEPAHGAVGEYNGKFMINQMVLRGSSCVTSLGHARASYRNFFHPDKRWQFSGVRLAADGRGGPGSRKGRTETGPASDFLRETLQGLAEPDKRLSSKHFYDDEGSRLFEAICDLPEYYPTRTETALLGTAAPEIAAHIPEGAVMVEFGSGASTKTRLVLDAAPQIAAYAPLDISRDALTTAAQAIARDYPGLQVVPLLGDFTHLVALPSAVDGRPRVGFFPGSTIGNFTRDAAVAFLKATRSFLGPDSIFVVGADIVKPEPVLIAAYDDAAGVTAAFNKNLLVRINRELGGDFDLEAFDHRAVWNPVASRIEMHLVSRSRQTVRVGDASFAFEAGETIHTENSHKYEPAAFQALAEAGGWRVTAQWIAPPPAFGVFLLSPA